MEYRGRYNAFDAGVIRTCPLVGRPNRVKLADLVRPAEALDRQYDLATEQRERIETLADHVCDHHRAGRPIAFFTGAHLIKNGLGPLLIDLIRRNLFSVVATNGAGAIHDFELALIGETSETVPNALPKGEFGMAYEFAYFNHCLSVGNQHKLGGGESLGRMICETDFRDEVLQAVQREGSPGGFAHPDCSILAAGYRARVPVTLHVGIGTDVTDQHPSFDGQAKGGVSGRDFLIFTEQIKRFTDGGMFINVGCAVTAPEVLLKAISMAASAGHPPNAILTADFDIRPFKPQDMADESSPFYYWRDQKSIVTRIPQAFGGTGVYVEGDQRITFPAFYQAVIERIA